MAEKMFWIAVAVLVGLVQVAVGKESDAFAEINNSKISDDKVKDALINDKISAAEEIDAFVTDYLVTYGVGLTVAEAKAIASKVRDGYTAESKQAYRKQLGKVLDLSDVLKRKLQVCQSTKGKRVEDFVENGLLRDITKRLTAMHDTWECPDGEDALLQKQKQAKESGKRETKSNPGIGAGLDWKYVTMIKQGIKSNPQMILQTVLGYLQSSGYISKDMAPIANMFVKHLSSNPDYLDYVVGAIDYAENFFESESGKRIVNVAPRLMTADSEEVMEILAREADYNQEAFFNMMANGDVVDGFMKQIARFLISSASFIKKNLDDDVRFAVLNGMLISNKFPAINRKNMLKSVVDVVEKLIKLFTVYRAETNLYQEVKVVADEFERLYFRFDDLERLSEKEVENVLSKFLQENILGPLKDAWLVHRHVQAEDERCAAQLACLYNARHRRANEIVRTMVKGLTATMAYSWTSAFDEADGVSLERLEEAKFHGQEEGADCSKFAPKRLSQDDTPVTECDVFKLEAAKEGSKGVQMNLNYEHNEL